MIYVTNRQKLKSTGLLAGRSPEATLVKLKGALEPSETNPTKTGSVAGTLNPRALEKPVFRPFWRTLKELPKDSQTQEVQTAAHI